MSHPTSDLLDAVLDGCETYVSGGGMESGVHAFLVSIETSGFAIVPKRPTEEMLKAGTEYSPDLTEAVLWSLWPVLLEAVWDMTP